MTNGEIRSDARSNVMQFFWPLMGLLSAALLMALLISLLTSGALSILNGMLGGSIMKGSIVDSLLNSAAQVVCVLVMAPYCVGACRELMEMFRDNAPSAGRAWGWMKDSVKCSCAYKLVARLCLRALLIGLAATALQILAAMWLGQGGLAGTLELLTTDTDVLMELGSNSQLQLFVLICSLVELGAELIMLLYAPAVYLQAADVGRTAQECIKGSVDIVKSHFGSFLGMTIVVGLQCIAVGVAVVLVVMLLSSVLQFLSVLGIVVSLALVFLFAFTIGSYSAACTYLWARGKGEALGIPLEIVD